jgi:hypothetical protein
MTEAEWLTSSDPLKALVFLRERLDPRTLRHPFRRFGDRRLRRKVLLFAGQVASLNYMKRDERPDDSEWLSEWLYIQDNVDRWSEDQLRYEDLSGEAHIFFFLFEHRISRSLEVWRSPWTVAARVVRTFLDRANTRSGGWACALLRDIFGNPFRPVAFSVAWRTETAVSLARQMYDSYDFSGLPVLADALQSAGCDSSDILGHCRSPGPHVRGCQVVDLVTARQ